MTWNPCFAEFGIWSYCLCTISISWRFYEWYGGLSGWPIVEFLKYLIYNFIFLYLEINFQLSPTFIWISKYMTCLLLTLHFLMTSSYRNFAMLVTPSFKCSRYLLPDIIVVWLITLFWLWLDEVFRLIILYVGDFSSAPHFFPW